jgi:Spy/CpxP family protein refolding chaperone
VTRRWILLAGLLAWVGVPTAVAWGAPGGASPRQEQKDEAFRMVDAYIVANIQESLGLDEDTYAKIIPVVTKLQKARRDFWEERGRMQRSMRHLLQSGTASQAQVRELLQSMKKLEVEGPERVREQMDALDALLTPLQQAKYRVFESDVEHRLRELLRQARRVRRSQ